VLVFSNSAAYPILVADRTGRGGKLQVREVDLLPEVSQRLALLGG